LRILTVDDHSRVILDVGDGSLESDYINASFIDVCLTPFLGHYLHVCDYSEHFVPGLQWKYF